MFQYTKETILNDVKNASVVSGVQNPYTLKEGVNRIVIKNVGEYYTDCIVGDVYRTNAVVGHEGSLDLSAVEAALVPGYEHTFTFRVVTPNQYLAEYASPNWQVFGKPMLVSFSVPAGDDEAAAKAAGMKNLMSAIELAIPADNQFVKIEGNVLKGTSNYMTFDKPCLEYYDPTNCDSCQGKYIKVDVDYEIIKNVEDFATKQ